MTVCVNATELLLLYWLILLIFFLLTIDADRQVTVVSDATTSKVSFSDSRTWTVLSFCLGGFSCLQASVNIIRPFAGLAWWAQGSMLGAHWLNLVNTIEPSMCHGDVAFLANYFDHLLWIGVIGNVKGKKLLKVIFSSITYFVQAFSAAFSQHS